MVGLAIFLSMSKVPIHQISSVKAKTCIWMQNCGKGVGCGKDAGQSEDRACWLSRHAPGLRLELIQAVKMCALFRSRWLRPGNHRRAVLARDGLKSYRAEMRAKATVWV